MLSELNTNKNSCGTYTEVTSIYSHKELISHPLRLELATSHMKKQFGATKSQCPWSFGTYIYTKEYIIFCVKIRLNGVNFYININI